MSIELEYRLRRSLRALLGKVGTPASAFALLGLAAVYLVASGLWARQGAREAEGALVGSFAFEVLAAALVLDAIASVLRGVPLGTDATGRLVLRAPTLAEGGGLLQRLAYLLAGLAFVASLYSRDVLTLRVAEGETADATAQAGQFVDRDPPRRFSPGPFPVSFEEERVRGVLREDGSVDGLSVEVRGAGARSRTSSRLGPLWEGWGRWLVPSRAGFALRYSIAVEGGGVLDSAFVKLDLLPEGTFQEVRSEVVPHRLVLAIPPGAGRPGDRPALSAVVLREGLVVGEGPLDGGGAIRFDGLVLAVPEVRRWVEFRMIRDPGLPLLGIGLLLAVAGALARYIEQRRAVRG